MSDLYLDEPLKLDWEKEEEIDYIDQVTSTHRITSSFNDGNIVVVNVEASGTYVHGELVSIDDIEVTGKETIYR